MQVQFYIDPFFSDLMRFALFLSFFLSILALFYKKWNMTYLGFFLVVADPRFNTQFLKFNIALWLLYILLILMIIKYRNSFVDISANKQFILKYRSKELYIFIIYALIISLVQDISITFKNFILLFSPFIFMVPIIRELVSLKRFIRNEHITFFRGLQFGYIYYLVLSHIFAPSKVSEGLGDISISSTILGIHSSYAIFITFYLIINSRYKKLVLFDLIAIVFFIISLQMTFSRGPFLSFTITIILMFLLRNKFGIVISKNLKYILLLLIGFVFLFMIFNIQSLFEIRKTYIDSSNPVNSFLQLFEKSRWSYALDVVDFEKLSLLDVFWGKGMGASEKIARSLGQFRIESFWLETLYDYGILGTSIFIIWLVKHFKRIFNQSVRDRNNLSLLYITIFLFTLLLSPFSFGWLLQGSNAFIYSFLLLFAFQNEVYMK